MLAIAPDDPLNLYRIVDYCETDDSNGDKSGLKEP